MKQVNFLLTICFLFGILTTNLHAEKIKLACVGNSITGFHQYTYYATPLQDMLGDSYLVDNFGKGASGIFKKFREEATTPEAPLEYTFAYVNSNECKEARDFLPDIVIIKFGANDSNMDNFTKPGIDGKKLFKEEYMLLVDTFRILPSNPKIYICIPPAMFYGEGGFFGAFGDKAMREYIQPAIKELVEENPDLGLIDFYTPTKDHPEFMPGGMDWVHPDHRGHYVMALAAYEAIEGKPFERPFVEGEFIPDPEKDYYIKNRKTGKVLTCKSKTVNQSVVVEELRLDDDSQLFKIENFSYNIYRLRNVYSGFQLKNTGSQVLASDNPTSDPLKYGMYINPVDGKYHSIGYNEKSLLGARTSSATIAGNRTLDNLTELDQWEFIEKDNAVSSVQNGGGPSSVSIKGMLGKIVIDNLDKTNDVTVCDLAGRMIVGNYNVSSTIFSVNVQPSIYIVSVKNINQEEKLKVIVK